MINPSEHKPDRTKSVPPPAAAPADPEHARRMAWLRQVRLMHRSKRMLGFAGIILGACMVVWARLSPAEAPPWAQYAGFGILTLSWLIFIYVIIDRGRWIKNNPYKPGAPPSP